MKKVALVFVIAVLAPSLVLAWLAVRSLRDQQFLLERQQSLLDQRVTDTLAQNIADYLAHQQQDFSALVESLAAGGDAHVLAAQFDDQLRRRWPLAEVGFCVTAAGKILSPQPNARPAAQMFRLDNAGFLGNREPVEVYLTANNLKNANSNAGNDGTPNFGRGQASQPPPASSDALANSSAQTVAASSVRPNSQALSDLPKPSAPSQPPPEPSGAPVSDPARFNPLPAPVSGFNARIISGNSLPATLGGDGGGSAVSGATDEGSINRNGPALPGPQPVEGLFATKDSRAPAPTASPPLTKHSTADINFAQNSTAIEKSQWLNTRNAFYIPAPPQTPPGTLRSNAVVAGRQNPVAALSAAAPPDTTRNDVRNDAPKDLPPQEVPTEVPSQSPSQNLLNYKAAQSRKVSPQSQVYQAAGKTKAEKSPTEEAEDNLSRVVPAEAEFRQLIGDQTDGMLARFLQNKLKLMCWHRLGSDPDLIFGAQLSLDRVVAGLGGLVQDEPFWGGGICVAVLDDNARPMVLSRDAFQANWKRPFVATEVGDALPHWEVAAYLVDPAQLTQAARTARLTLGLLIGVLVVAIGIGSLLIVRSLSAELKLARQKTDFVSNVSHELKSPLTSIRMFSELLAEGRVADPAKHRSYLHIITAETARLTRLINNVLDFSRMERGEKKYNFQPCDLTEIVRSTAETFRPHLESAGFHFACELPAAPIPLRGDADALSQIIVNLLSNAEKYSAAAERRSPTRLAAAANANDLPAPENDAPQKEILVRLTQRQSPVPYAEIQVLDRGPGVPRGCEEKIFEKFYRAHDSLSSGIQGSGLGLTIARQIARAHGGDVVYEPREDGGSCFSMRLPVPKV